jgi:predicted O-linked N-acetylglucosamine transferase (SPINDLY family)
VIEPGLLFYLISGSEFICSYIGSGLRHLKTYHRIDICLDTFPYNRHTTSLNSNWMGVPVITQVGHTIVGRVGCSQLNNLGLPELTAFNELL